MRKIVTVSNGVSKIDTVIDLTRITKSGYVYANPKLEKQILFTEIDKEVSDFIDANKNSVVKVLIDDEEFNLGDELKSLLNLSRLFKLDS